MPCCPYCVCKFILLYNAEHPFCFFCVHRTFLEVFIYNMNEEVKQKVAKLLNAASKLLVSSGPQPTTSGTSPSVRNDDAPSGSSSASSPTGGFTVKHVNSALSYTTFFVVLLGKRLFYGEGLPQNRLVDMYHAASPPNVKNLYLFWTARNWTLSRPLLKVMRNP